MDKLPGTAASGIERIIALVKERAEGGANRLREALEIARDHGIGDEWVLKGFEDAEKALNEAAFKNLQNENQNVSKLVKLSKLRSAVMIITFLLVS